MEVFILEVNNKKFSKVVSYLVSPYLADVRNVDTRNKRVNLKNTLCTMPLVVEISCQAYLLF